MDRASEGLLDQVERIDQHPHAVQPLRLELREVGDAQADRPVGIGAVSE
jgi:hypothetical protein